MLFFTESGRCFWLRVYEIPEGSRLSKGRAIQNIINIPKEEKIKAKKEAAAPVQQPAEPAVDFVEAGKAVENAPASSGN